MSVAIALPKAIVEQIAALTKPSVAASPDKSASDFQRFTEELATILGYKVAKDGQLWTLTKGKVKVTVQHSAKGYVRQVLVNGQALWANPAGQKDKHLTLAGKGAESVLAKLAMAK
jgi:archaeosine-15-forming tRNA-guanine transglycosylase